MNIPLPNSRSAISLNVQNATFTRQNQAVFSGLNWQIKPGEQWAVYGPVGSGKTSLLEALLGRLFLKSGILAVKQVTETGVVHDISRSDLSRLTAYVAFQGSDNYFNYERAFYQQRYQSLESEIAVPRVLEVLQKSAPADSFENILPIAEQLQLTPLLPLEVIKLSNGQTRKLQLARALLRQPTWLILDNPFTGLDESSREQLKESVNSLMEQGMPVLLATNQTELPEKITHVLWLNQFKIQGVYSRAGFYNKLNTENQNKQSTATAATLTILPKRTPDFSIAVKLEAVNITYSGKNILRNISWTVQRGEKWALTGPNGSGKSTLLSLIYADNPQAFANKITLFDRRKGSGESIWELKKRMGFVSPELHLYFKSALTGLEVAATGFTDTLTRPKQITPEQQDLIQHHLTYFKRSDLSSKIFRQLSTGEQRLLLLIRSLIKNPDLIIWDEPFQGLSQEYIFLATNLLDQYCKADTTLILVSHHAHEIPSFVTKHMHLEAGQVKSLEPQCRFSGNR